MKNKPPELEHYEDSDLLKRDLELYELANMGVRPPCPHYHEFGPLLADDVHCKGTCQKSGALLDRKSVV